MSGVDVVIFHHAPTAADPPLVRGLAEARDRLMRHQSALFERGGAGRIVVAAGREDAPDDAESFGRRVTRLVEEERIGRLIVLGSGAVPRLTPRDARALVETAAAHERFALTNNRYSSDICAVSDAGALRDLPALPSDNSLPRWLEERAGFEVRELPGRERLALDLDTPLDVALLALAPRAPRSVTQVASANGWHVPHLEALRELARDPHRELLVFGRAGSTMLRWLERNVRCRVRFLAEERGLRASSPLAIGDPGQPQPRARPPRTSIGRLLALRRPEALGDLVAELADGAILDTRVLMADRWGADESAWPPPADRFASDLLLADEVADPWLRAITKAAAAAPIPITLGAHTLVGPGVPLILGGPR